MLATLRKQTPDKYFLVVSAALAASLAWGCAASHTTVVKPSGAPVALQTATKQELIERYNLQAAAVSSINASVKLTLTAGSTYTGVIKQYHEINGFILAQKPASIRLIGQAPVVGTNLFDMESDGETFNVFIPSQKKYITGPANLERTSAKPIENLRPQHLTGAIFWMRSRRGTLCCWRRRRDEASQETRQYYVLTIVRAEGGASAGATAAADWEIAQKVWFDRADLNVARVETYESGGKIGSDIHYGKWDTFGTVKYPREISLARPGEDYKLDIGITKLTVNEDDCRRPVRAASASGSGVGERRRRVPRREATGDDAPGCKTREDETMIGHMILQNALHRPVRTAITVIAVAIEVMLVIIVVGLTSGLLLDSAKRTEGVGADVMVQPPSASIFMAFSGAPMPISIGSKLQQMEYVQAVAPVLVQFNSVNGLDIVYGIQPDSFTAVSRGFVMLAGRELQDPNDILVDDVYAKGKKDQSRADAAHIGARFSRGWNRGARQGCAAVRTDVHVARNGGRSRQGLGFLRQVRPFGPYGRCNG